jgi:hypothetical protein
MLLTCPWCGWNEIERPMIDVGEAIIEGLAECTVCGAEEIDPEELDSEPDHRNGWRQAAVVKLYDPARHGPLQDRYFAIVCGTSYQAYTESGRLVQLPEDHPMVQNCKGYYEAQRAAREQGAARIEGGK